MRSMSINDRLIRIAGSLRVNMCRVGVLAILSVLAGPSWAGGGLTAGTQAVSNFTLWFYGFVGVLAGSYLLWVGIQCWSNKADWIHDFGGAIAKTAAVGGSLVLAGWAFGLFA